MIPGSPHESRLPTIQDRLAAREGPINGRPVMFQSWRELLFLHWTVDAREIQRTLPQGLAVDTFEGNAYLGIVPFFMHDVRPRCCPRVPRVSDFLELNVRTYVYDALGKPGVWFYSLDASQPLAVAAARRFFHLPYFRSRMKAETNEQTGEISYLSHRLGIEKSLSSCFRYRPRGKPHHAGYGTLEFFLIERYVLFALSQKPVQLWAGKVHHRPYPLQDVEVTEWDDCLFSVVGLKRPNRQPDHVVMSPGVDVEVFGLERVSPNLLPLQ